LVFLAQAEESLKRRIINARQMTEPAPAAAAGRKAAGMSFSSGTVLSYVLVAAALMLNLSYLRADSWFSSNSRSESGRLR
jgi:hypothetical protein